MASLFHLHHERVDATVQVTIRSDRGDRDAQARDGRDQRLRDAARERRRIADAMLGDGVEGPDHAHDGAEESEQRRDRGDRAERVQEALQLVHDVPSGVLDALLDYGARPLLLREARGQDLAERRGIAERADVALIELLSTQPHTFAARSAGTTRFACRLHRRSRMMAAAMTEQAMRGAMTQPPALTISNMDDDQLRAFAALA